MMTSISCLCAQLAQQRVPEALWDRILEKFLNEEFDAGARIAIQFDASQPAGARHCAVAARDMSPHDDVYLIDHIWSFPSLPKAMEDLKHNSGLRDRLIQILGLDGASEYWDSSHSIEHCENLDEMISVILKAASPLIGSYAIEFSSPDEDSKVVETVYFIMDEIGSRLHSARISGLDCVYMQRMDSSDRGDPSCNCSSGILVSMDRGAISFLWPTTSIEEGDELVCRELRHGRSKQYALEHVLAVPCFVNLAKEAELTGLTCREKASEEVLDIHSDALDSREGIDEVEDANMKATLSSRLQRSISALSVFREKLFELNYNVECILKILKLPQYGRYLPVWDMSTPGPREAYLKTLDSHLELDGNMSAFQLIELVKLFLCGVDLPREAVVSILGEDVTSELVYLNILFPYHTYEPFRLSSSDSDGVADDIESAPGEIVEEIACLRVKKNATSVLKEIPVDKASSTHGGCYFRSLVQLTPVAIYPVGCSGISNGASKSATGLFVTDFAQVGSTSGIEPVMYIGPDSLGLVAAQPLINRPTITNDRNKSILDLCSGSGVQSISALLSRVGATATMIELNPRAILFSIFNAMLNKVWNRMNIRQGDIMMISKALELSEARSRSLLLSSIAPPKTFSGFFNIVLANPPYIPSDKSSKDVSKEQDDSKLLGYGDGGEFGEMITAAIVECVRECLDPDEGLFVLIGNLCNVSEYPLKFKRWWACGSQGRAIDDSILKGLIIHGKLWNPSEYAALVFGSALVSQMSATSKIEPTSDGLTDSTQIESMKRAREYAEGLSISGVHDVTNGILFVSSCSTQKPPPESEDVVDIDATSVVGEKKCINVPILSVRHTEEHIWQSLSIGGTHAALSTRTLLDWMDE